MRNQKEIAEIVLAEAKILRAKRQRRKRNLSIAAASVFVLMITVPFIAPVEFSAKGILPHVVGDAGIMGDAAVGGYVLIGLCGLIAGVIITIICQRIAMRSRKDSSGTPH
jgi:predicted PurR-regulated permease PerM